MSETKTAERQIIQMLNDALLLDRVGVTAMFRTVVPVRCSIADHKHLVVIPFDEELVGLTVSGIIQGVLSILGNTHSLVVQYNDDLLINEFLCYAADSDNVAVPGG